jgi:hypothetical protein
MAATLAWMRFRLMLPADAPGTREAMNERRSCDSNRCAASRSVKPPSGSIASPSSAATFLHVPSQRSRRSGVQGITELLRACLAALRLDLPVGAYPPRVVPLWRLSDALSPFEDLLPKVPQSDHRLPAKHRGGLPGSGQQCRVAVASTLLASPELARKGALTLEQPAVMMPVEVYWRQLPGA